MKRSVVFASTAKRFVQFQGNSSIVTPLVFYCRRRSFSVSSYGYREKIRVGFLQDIKFDDAIGLFVEMVRCRPLPSIIDFSRLLTAIAKMKKHDVVISLGEKMQSLGISHDLYTYNIFINCFCLRSQLCLALATLGKMIKLGYKPSIVTGIGSPMRYLLLIKWWQWDINLILLRLQLLSMDFFSTTKSLKRWL
ncbi:unnamed protein product [Cochlearia groenlandica]